MFDSQVHDAKHNAASPPFGARTGGMFDSPKPAGGFMPVGLNSPHFGGSQQSTGNIDNVFADLLNDQDHIGGFDSVAQQDRGAGGAGLDGLGRRVGDGVEMATQQQQQRPDVVMQDATDGAAVPLQDQQQQVRHVSLMMDDFFGSGNGQ